MKTLKIGHITAMAHRQAISGQFRLAGAVPMRREMRSGGYFHQARPATGGYLA